MEKFNLILGVFQLGHLQYALEFLLIAIAVE